MRKNDVRNIIVDAVKSNGVECSQAGDRKNKLFLFIKNTDNDGFLVTIEDETLSTPSLQEVKTNMHKLVCQDLISRYKRNRPDEKDDEFGRKCSLADNVGAVLLSYITPALETLESSVFTDARGATEAKAWRAILCAVESLAYYVIAGLVELGDASSKEISFEGICEGLNALYDKKNRDYDDAFAKSLDKYGLTVLCIRLSDKLNRFKALAVDCREQVVDDESIFDTLRDFANYAILTLVEMRMETDYTGDFDVLRKLAEYESTGLQVDTCRKLAKARATGRLISVPEWPVKIGDSVGRYRITGADWENKELTFKDCLDSEDDD